MTKRKNFGRKAKELSPIQLKVQELEEKGMTVGLVIGIKDNGVMLIDSTLNSYEEVHAALNRAALEVTMSHIKYVNENANKGTEVGI